MPLHLDLDLLGISSRELAYSITYQPCTENILLTKLGKIFPPIDLKMRKDQNKTIGGKNSVALYQAYFCVSGNCFVMLTYRIRCGISIQGDVATSHMNAFWAQTSRETMLMP